jgi:hypothetical protein
MNDFTYGKSEAAKILVGLLKEKPKLRSKVSAKLHSYEKGFNEIVNSKLSKKLKTTLIKFLYEKGKNVIEKINYEDVEKAKTFSLNVFQTNFKEKLNQIKNE